MTTPQFPQSPPPRPGSRGGGILIAAGLLLGPIIGIFVGQVSAGLIAGGALGIVAAVVLALIDRTRKN